MGIIRDALKGEFNTAFGKTKGFVPFSLVIEKMSPPGDQETRAGRMLVNKAADHLHGPEATFLELAPNPLNVGCGYFVETIDQQMDIPSTPCPDKVRWMSEADPFGVPFNNF